MKNIIFRLCLLTLLILPFLFSFKISLNSDTLFLDSFFRDIYQFKGSWYDWKMTPAPAYLPDMLIYAIFYPLVPSVPGRILAVSVIQVLLLAGVIQWVAKVIRPNLSIGAKTFLLLTLLALILVASNSRMWLFFYSANNHFSSLIFSLICLGLYFRLNANWTRKNVIFFSLTVIFAQLSSSLFFLTFSLPLVLVCTSQFLFLKKEQLSWFKKNKFLLLIAISHIFSHVLSKLITNHNPLSGRVGFDVSNTLNSLKFFIEATKVTFSFNNSYTFAFVLLIIFSFTHLTYHFFNMKRVFSKVKLKELFSAQSSGSLNVNQRHDFTFMYLMLVIPVTIIGSIFSGGFSDIFGYRYFSFPIALCLILWALVLDKKYLFDKYYNVLICIYVLLLAITFFSFKALSGESRRSDYYRLYQSGIYTEQENTAECLNDLSDQGFNLRSGVADYFYARGVSYKTKDNLFILSLRNDAMPLFWMSSLGPLKHPKYYDSVYYNFLILIKANYQDQFNLNSATIGVLLPKASEKIDCGNTEIWLYKDQSLDDFIKEKIEKFLLIKAGKRGFDYLPKNLPSETGRVSGSRRFAIQGEDKPGFLTYGPYIKLANGTYKIQIKYQSNSEKNSWDMGRFNDKRKYFNDNVIVASGALPNSHSKVTEYSIFVNIKDDISQLELRTLYGGEGNFIIHSMEILPEKNIK